MLKITHEEAKLLYRLVKCEVRTEEHLSRFSESFPLLLSLKDKLQKVVKDG
jgi:hypothetical protein